MTKFESSEENSMIQQKGSFVENVVAKAASTFVENCGLCTIYCDKQVQYETVVEQYNISTQLGGLFKKLDDSVEVQVCRDFMFDEDSVVHQANSRSDDE
jgi:aldehyde:ferredoxin oxidoreductase